MNRFRRWLWSALFSILVVMFAAGLAYSFPADMAFLLAINLVTWAEAAIAVYVVATVTKVRPLVTYLRAIFLRRRAGAVRQQRTHKIPRPDCSNDNDDDPIALAAA